MRSEKEMMNLILSTAAQDERIRAVLLNGSRANPNAPRDIFQDYDVIFIVRELQSFIEGHGYPAVFGTPLIVQMPETMRDPMGDGRFTYLTLYDDGSRIDLQIFPVDRWETIWRRESQTIALLDKDGILPLFPPASDEDYYIKRPTENDFFSCCNNFWWCVQNVAKGIWRGELPFAMEEYHGVVRAELNCMVCWAIGMRNEFAVSAGKHGKYFKNFLNEEEYRRYAATYSGGADEDFWEALFQACGLFEDLSRQVAKRFSYPYCQADADNMKAYLRHVRTLPRDGAGIF